MAELMKLRYDYARAIEDTIVRTDEGYLRIDAYLARDGLLRYSDGVDSWLEMRPRAELEAAAGTWADKPITDDHPREMVSADSWRHHARGHVLGTPTIETGIDGVTYLRARLQITDAELIRKIEAGQRELSIGFTSVVVPAADGERYDAVQTSLLGNHVASVSRGRAGPNVKVFMDGAAALVTTEGSIMKKRKVKIDDKRSIEIGEVETRKDEMGTPVEMVMVTGPDGVETMVPTWVAALLEELAGLKNAPEMEPPAPAPEPEPAPAPAPAPDAAALPVPAPGAPAPAANPEDEEKMTDKVTALVRRRARLERLAAKAGIKDDKIDALDDDALAREFVATRTPYAKPVAEKAKGDALDLLVDAAAAAPSPEPKTEPANPWERPVKVKDADEDEDEDAEVVAAFLAKAGY